MSQVLLKSQKDELVALLKANNETVEGFGGESTMPSPDEDWVYVGRILVDTSSAGKYLVMQMVSTQGRHLQGGFKRLMHSNGNFRFLKPLQKFKGKDLKEFNVSLKAYNEDKKAPTVMETKTSMKLVKEDGNDMTREEVADLEFATFQEVKDLLIKATATLETVA